MKKVLVFGISDQVGGTEAVIMNYYRHFDKGKIHCDFLVNTKKPVFKDELTKSGSKIYIITARSKNLKRYKEELRAFFRRHAKEYDSIWVNLNSLTNIDYLKMAKKYGIKKRIVHAHNTSDKSKLRLFFHYVNKMFLSKYATDFWACSDEAAKFFYGPKAYREKKIINDAIDLPKYRFSIESRNRIRKELKISDDKIVLVNIGRLCYQKNQSFLVEIMSRLDKNKYILLLVGDGEDREMIENKIDELGVRDNVYVMGSREDVPEILSASDIFAFPSRYEGLGLATIESSVAGLPLVLSEAASHNVSKLGLYGLVILPVEVGKWLSAIERVSPEKRLANSAMNCELLEKCSYDIVSQAKKIEAGL